MTAEAQRIAIAEAYGYKQFQSKFSSEQQVWALSQEHANTLRLGDWLWALIPDYLNDLNACHEMEKVLTFSQREIYATLLIDWYKPDFEALHATAAQRSEAFLKCLNLWKEVTP